VTGTYVGAALVEVDGIEDLEREVFGPVLHMASFKAQDIDKTVDAINARGFGLTFGLHTRIDDRVEQIVDRIHVGQHLRQPQPDRRRRRQPALRGEGPVGHRAEGGRPGLCRAVLP
jgi:RHH-type proline utilization regulon transcriptional repressor/proline dehydrogenase/delta 1-pyrroline-5-carboxylate dehydrogenase